MYNTSAFRLLISLMASKTPTAVASQSYWASCVCNFYFKRTMFQTSWRSASLSVALYRHCLICSRRTVCRPNPTSRQCTRIDERLRLCATFTTGGGVEAIVNTRLLEINEPGRGQVVNVVSLYNDNKRRWLYRCNFARALSQNSTVDSPKFEFPILLP